MDYDLICPYCKKKIEYSYNFVKDCEHCDQTVCIDCIRVTCCQTTWGICKNCCDNILCQDCEVTNISHQLKNDYTYILDLPDDEYYQDLICENCKKEKNKIE